MELHYWEGMKGPEIAEVLGIPEGTVRSRLRRGLEAIKTQVASFDTSEVLLESTLTDLEDWAQALKDDAFS